jgi:enoyl-CoA hydratase/carnithine racemase
MAAFTRLYAWLDEFPVPIIAVAVGNCVGAGAEIVAGADLRVGGDNLQLAWAGARLGVPVGPARLTPLVGLARAKDLILTGRTITMVDAVTLGILQRSAAADEAEDIALHLAGEIAQQHPSGIRVLKQMFRDLEGSATRTAYENEHLMRFQQHGAGIPRTR